MTTEADATHPDARRKALHAIALFEAVKGVAAIVASLGLLGLLHADVHRLALALLWRFHLDPAEHYPELLLHYADLLSAINLRHFAPVAVAYIALRFTEAYGLWKEKIWAEWLGALSGGLYIPLEVAHFYHRPTLINGAVMLLNIVMVAFLGYQLYRRMKTAVKAAPVMAAGVAGEAPAMPAAPAEK